MRLRRLCVIYRAQQHHAGSSAIRQRTGHPVERVVVLAALGQVINPKNDGFGLLPQVDERLKVAARLGVPMAV